MSPPHDPMVCGIFFESSCDQCKELWLDHPRWCEAEEMELRAVVEWYWRIPAGTLKDRVREKIRRAAKGEGGGWAKR